VAWRRAAFIVLLPAAAMSATSAESATPTILPAVASTVTASSSSSPPPPPAQAPPSKAAALQTKIDGLLAEIDGADDSASSSAQLHHYVAQRKQRLLELQIQLVQTKVEVVEKRRDCRLEGDTVWLEYSAELKQLRAKEAQLRDELKILLLDAQLQRSRHSSAEASAGASGGESPTHTCMQGVRCGYPPLWTTDECLVCGAGGMFHVCRCVVWA
jgi:hypothetical protein